MKGATWLITGGTGAFGQAFTRELLDHWEPQSVRILSRDEAKHAAMKAKFADDRLRFLVGNVSSQDRMELACDGADYVAHAAAMKRIEVCEENPWQAVESNIMGTHSVAQACIAKNVEKAVFLSTDKAASPNTHYGATKLCAERLWIASNVYAAGKGTLLSATRYGNVLNSTGSVVPVWRQQAASGSITVTNPHMTRFFMDMTAAVRLVVTAFQTMTGGEVFIPKLKAASIATLAHAVAPHCTTTPMGIRPGEKMHEILVGPDEVRQTYDRGDFYVIVPSAPTWGITRAHGIPVSSSFTYTSNTVSQLSEDDLKAMIE